MQLKSERFQSGHKKTPSSSSPELCISRRTVAAQHTATARDRVGNDERRCPPRAHENTKDDDTRDDDGWLPSNGARDDLRRFRETTGRSERGLRTARASSPLCSRLYLGPRVHDAITTGERDAYKPNFGGGGDDLVVVVVSLLLPVASPSISQKLTHSLLLMSDNMSVTSGVQEKVSKCVLLAELDVSYLSSSVSSSRSMSEECSCSRSKL